MNKKKKKKKTGWKYRAKVQGPYGMTNLVKGGPMTLCRALVRLGYDPREMEIKRKPTRKGLAVWCDVPRPEIERCLKTIYGGLDRAEVMIAFYALADAEPSVSPYGSWVWSVDSWHTKKGPR